MKRRLKLLLGTFLTLALVFVVYWLTAEKVPFFKGKDQPQDRQDSLRTMRPGETDFSEGEGLSIVDRDDTGRLRAVYWARRWEKLTPNTYKLQHPTVSYYPRDGRSVCISADEGEVYAEEAAGKLNIRGGTLSGNVRVFFDRTARAPLPLPEDEDHEYSKKVSDILSPRLDELIRIYADDVEFDNDRLLIRADKRVTVFSPEVDIYGRGLRIEWNQEPRELRLMRIDHGELMAIKVPREGMQKLGVGGASEEASSEVDVETPTTSAWVDFAPGEVPGFVPSTSPTTTSAPATRPVKRLPANVYLAKFHGKDKLVHVDFGDNHVHGAEELALRFEWDTSWRPWEKDKKLSARPQAISESEPSTRPSADPTSTTRPVSNSEKQGTEKEPPTDLMLITWSGPLTIEPVGRTENPSRDRYVVSGKGHEVILKDPQSKATCQECFFYHPQEKVELRGTKESPVRLELPDENTAVCEVIRFDRRTGWVRFDGPGKMTGTVGEIAWGAPGAETPSEGEDKSSYIAWENYAEAQLLEEKESLPDGTEKSRFSIREIDFDGKVELTKADTGEYLRSDHLRVELDRDAEGRVYPRLAIATGNLTAKQEGSTLSAQKAIVEFEPEEKEEAEEGKEEEHSEGREERRVFRPVKMTAEGDVHAVYVDREDPDAPPITVKADRIESDLIRQTHHFFGKGDAPATIVRGTKETVFGKDLYLDEEDQVARVKGEGKFEFETTESLRGELSAPLPATVAWKKKMAFNNRRGTLEFHGDVRFDIGEDLDHIYCDEELYLLFARDKDSESENPAAAKKTKDSDERRLSALARGTEDYRRRIAMIVAKENVEVLSPKLDEEGNLEERILLNAQDTLLYDAKHNQLDVIGAGDLTAEDYRPPEPEKTKPRVADSEIPDRIERPWQTLFEWKELMSFSVKDGTVVLKGDVYMTHHSGRQVVAAEGIKHKPWGTLPEGRLTMLWCDTLTADFAPPESSTKGASTSGPEPSKALEELGELTRFTAKRNVTVKDGVTEKTNIRCQLIVYDKNRAIFTIQGAIPGQAPTDAIVKRGARVSRGQEIIYDLDSKTARVTKVSVGGIR